MISVTARLIFFTCLVYPLFLQAKIFPINRNHSMYGTGEITIPCELNDLDFFCKIDFGAPMNVVYTNRVIKTKEIIKTDIMYKAFSGDFVLCKMANVSQLRVLDHDSNLVETVLICPLPEGRDEVILVGMSTFKNQQVNFILSKNYIEIEEKPVNKYKSSYLTDDSDHLLIDVMSDKISKKKILAMWDSGASLTIIDQDIVKNYPDAFTVVKTIDMGVDTLGNALVGHMVIGNINIQGHSFVAEYFMALDFTSIRKEMGEKVNMILGYNIISQVDWYFDLINHTWELR